MSQYKLSPDAAEDIERIFLFGIERFGAILATKYLDGLEMRLAQIAQVPATYPEVSQIRVGYRRSVYGVHSIYYRELDNNTVEITRVIGREHLSL
jgi:toxin ParE1/3/4